MCVGSRACEKREMKRVTLQVKKRTREVRRAATITKASRFEGFRDLQGVVMGVDVELVWIRGSVEITGCCV